MFDMSTVTFVNCNAARPAAFLLKYLSDFGEFCLQNCNCIGFWMCLWSNVLGPK